MTNDIWSPEQYQAFREHRRRPFFELLARVEAAGPEYVADLGCGPGDLTAELAKRWPDADVMGIDNSPAMIETARRLEGGRLRFGEGDIASWRPARPLDLLISSAALQWVPGHQDLLPGWVAALSPGGWLAFTVPGNFNAPAHVLLRELCSAPRWRSITAPVLRQGDVSSPAEYLDLLAPLGCAVDAWETTYEQVLPGHDAVLEWMKGTGLRPVLAALADDAERAAFLADYGPLLSAAYPARPYGTVYSFRRVFVVARRAS